MKGGRGGQNGGTNEERLYKNTERLWRGRLKEKYWKWIQLFSYKIQFIICRILHNCSKVTFSSWWDITDQDLCKQAIRLRKYTDYCNEGQSGQQMCQKVSRPLYKLGWNMWKIKCKTPQPGRNKSLCRSRPSRVHLIALCGFAWLSTPSH